MARYILTEQAQEDIEWIWVSIASDNVDAADRLIDRFTVVFALLAAHPNLGRQQDIYRAGLRSFAIGRYVIFYHPHSDNVQVVRVLHGARFLADLL